MKTYIKYAAAAGAVLMSCGAGANVIDLFSDPPAGQSVTDSTTADGGVFNEAGNFPATILGGYRDLYVETISQNFPATGTDTKIAVGGGFLSYSQESGVTGEGKVQWDGNDNSPDLAFTGLGGIDFINQLGCPVSGCDTITFTVQQADAGFLFSVGIYTDVDTFTKITLISDGNPGTSTLPFAFFQDTSLCGTTNPQPGVAKFECGNGNLMGTDVVNFASVGAMEVGINVPDANGDRVVDIDLTIGSITKTGVPEPATVALLGVGLVAGGMVRRRKRELASV